MDGRQTWVYCMQTAFGQRWVGWPLAAVLQRVTADSGGVHTFDHLRAYRKARDAGKLGDGRVSWYHGFAVTRTHKDDMDCMGHGARAAEHRGGRPGRGARSRCERVSCR